MARTRLTRQVKKILNMKSLDSLVKYHNIVGPADFLFQCIEAMRYIENVGDIKSLPLYINHPHAGIKRKVIERFQRG